MRLPLNVASRLWGRLNNIDLPVWAREPVLGLYVRLFHCDMSEAAVTDLRHYHSVSELFRRQLRPDCRQVDYNCSLVCSVKCYLVHVVSCQLLKTITFQTDRQ